MNLTTCDLLASVFAAPLLAVAPAGHAQPKPIRLIGFDIDTWFGLLGPARLPADVTRRLNKARVEALSSPELKARLATLTAKSTASLSEQLADFVKSEVAPHERVATASGAKVE